MTSAKTSKDLEILYATFYNQIQDALDILEEIRPQLRKLAKVSPTRSPTTFPDMEESFPKLVESASGLNGILHMAMGTYGNIDILTIHAKPESE